MRAGLRSLTGRLEGRVVSMTDFSSIAFETSLSFQALLLVVFGFSYAIFAMFYTNLTPENPRPAPIVYHLRRICRFLALLLVINFILALYSLVNMYTIGTLSKIGNLILSIGFTTLSLIITLFCIIWSFKFMS